MIPASFYLQPPWALGLKALRSNRTIGILLAAGRHLGDRGDEFRVPGAATEVTGNPVADLLLARAGVLLQERGGRHDRAGNAEAALWRAVTDEGLLNRMQRPGLGQALDGANLT